MPGSSDSSSLVTSAGSGSEAGWKGPTSISSLIGRKVALFSSSSVAVLISSAVVIFESSGVGSGTGPDQSLESASEGGLRTVFSCAVADVVVVEKVLLLDAGLA